MTKLINDLDFSNFISYWKNAKPFSHIVIDNFLTESVSENIVKEFPNFNDDIWYVYDNPLEIKKAMNSWDRFGPTIYKLFWFLNSREFIDRLEVLTECKLYADFGLNGGGLHSHRSGGKLNTHLDYSMHPKLPLERRLNLILYMTPNWEEEWGGALGFWEHNLITNKPGELVTKTSPKFNRAVLFDTTQNSWHGLPEPIKSPQNITRNSLAIYYLCDPRENTDKRNRALYVPYGDQQNDETVLEMIRKRSNFSESQTVYRTK